jgi:hypothetical protein
MTVDSHTTFFTPPTVNAETDNHVLVLLAFKIC